MNSGCGSVEKYSKFKILTYLQPFDPVRSSVDLTLLPVNGSSTLVASRILSTNIQRGVKINLWKKDVKLT